MKKTTFLLAVGLILLTGSVGCLQPQPASPMPGSFHFTITSDIHQRADAYANVLDAMLAGSGGQGAFQISVGDVVDSAGQSPEVLRAVIDSKFGSQAVWYPVVGNHDTKSEPAIQWRRDEFNKGSGGRPPLKNAIKNPGPPGGTETTYSFDYGNAHFVILNEYYNGKADTGTGGDVVSALLEWLEADLAANTKPLIFVFGHEPAFVQSRHVGDSLDANVAHRDAFWKILVKYKVQAFFSGHTHYYYKELHEGVYQICDGNVGKGSTEKHQTYLDVAVEADRAEVRVWQNDADGGTRWKVVETLTLMAQAKTSAAPPAVVPKAVAA
jgi:hypothetical protein